MEFSHTPVLLQECIEGLKIDPDGLYLDGTTGGAGHSFEIANRLTGGRLYCLDKDPQAIRAASEKLRPFHQVTILQGDFRNAEDVTGLPPGSLSGVLLDLGVSSHQLDRAERGFSYHQHGRLDMRMSGEGMTAAEIVNTWPQQELVRILRLYGEEPYAPLIASKIVANRELHCIETTEELSEVVLSALPARIRRKEKHPARRTFQALRIAVNDELDALREGLKVLFELLAPKGRLCIISFHSLEDRIVKQYFASLLEGCTCPPDFPICVCGKSPRANQITRKPIVPDQEECNINRRARSARLRIVEKKFETVLG